MANKSVITTDKAPAAIGTYSQAVKVGDTVYLSGQLPLVAETMEIVGGDFAAQTRQVFENLKAVCEAAGGGLDDIVKLNIYMTDLSNFATVNEVMATYFHQPYPARAAIGVAALPKDVPVEMEAVMVLS
ncbi:RidA family protein [Marinobacter sp. X15-166B]|uniref:RidA family protein n=1 Tax=Marinobacter sp. X15-166B TaxID=1897620 RepID=UPI00085C353D|nr:RidA family protein [Marinobacter sp. X15-166B]OEY66496.1 reactive intermediate/imine deaminase [Marinobacter sp. X15-166B]